MSYGGVAYDEEKDLYYVEFVSNDLEERYPFMDILFWGIDSELLHGFSIAEIEVYAKHPKKELEAAIAECENIELYNYTYIIREQVASYLESAYEVLEAEETYIEDEESYYKDYLPEMWSILDSLKWCLESCEYYKKEIDLTELATLYEDCEQYEQSDYTESSFQCLEDAMEQAYAMLYDEAYDNATQEEADETLEILMSAKSALVKIIPVSSVTLDQTILTFTEEGETVTLTATVVPENADSKEVTWASSDETVVTVVDGVVTVVGEGTATITATADGVSAVCDVVVDYPETKLALTVTADSSEAGEVTVTLPEGKTATELVLDDVVTVTATASEAYKFMYWMNLDTKQQVSNKATYTFNMFTNTNLSAVFVEKEKYTVIFKTSGKFSNKQILGEVAEGGSITAPESTLEFIGYVFEGWTDGNTVYKPGDVIEVTGDITYEAVYKAENLYEVTVTDGVLSIIEGEATIDENKYVMDTILTATADKTKDGQVFAGWYNSEGTLLSVNTVYKFYVKGNLALTPVYADVVEKQEAPILAFNTYTRVQESTGKDKVRMQITWENAEKCTVVGMGILRTYNAAAATESALVVGTTVSGITTNAASTVYQNGSYAYNLTIGATSANQNNSVYARGYVRYTVEGSDEIKVVYTDIVQMKPVS